MKRDTSGVPRRWTNANFHQAQREADGRIRLYEWTETIGRATSAQARAAREGRVHFERRSGDLSTLRRSECTG